MVEPPAKIMEESSNIVNAVWLKQEPLWDDSSGSEATTQVNDASYEVKQEIPMMVFPENGNETSKDKSMCLKEEPEWDDVYSSNISQATQSSFDCHIKTEPDLDSLNSNSNTPILYNQEIKKEQECIDSARSSGEADMSHIVKEPREPYKSAFSAQQMKKEPSNSEAGHTIHIKDELRVNSQVKNEEWIHGAGLQTGYLIDEPGRGAPKSATVREQSESSSKITSDAPLAPTTPDSPPHQQDSLLVERKPKRDPHACDVCDKEFKKKGKLTRHKKTHAAEKPYPCTKCDKKFTRPHHLREHDRSHTGEMPYSCDLCGKKYSQSRRLKSHKLTHNHVKPAMLTCDVCQKGFTQFGHLMTHKRLHSGEKPYTCEICKREFAQLVYLKEHVRIHSGVKEYRCDVCTKEFTRMGELRRHRLIHTKAKPYECVTCKKAFKQSSHLKRHQLVHTKVKQFCCDICLKCFTQKSTLGKHKLLHSNDSNAVASNEKISDHTNELRV